jgi:hypothetical protein
LIPIGLWRGRRGSNSRPLPRQSEISKGIIELRGFFGSRKEQKVLYRA